MIDNKVKSMVHVLVADSRSPMFSNRNDAGIRYWSDVLSSFIEDEGCTFDGLIFNSNGIVCFRELYNDSSTTSMFFDGGEDPLLWEDFFPSDLESFKLTKEEAIEIKAILTL